MIRPFLLLSSLLLAIVGCKPLTLTNDAAASWPLQSGAPTTNLTEHCVEDYDPSVDYFPDKITIERATNFSVSYHGHYKVVRSQVEVSEERTVPSDVLILVQCGTPAPELSGDLAEATVIEVPVGTVAANEDGSIMRTAMLGFDERIIGIGGGGIYDLDLRQRWEAKEIASIGASFHGPPRFEVLLAIKPGVVFKSTSSLDHTEALSRGRTLGLPLVPILAWSEPTILGQTEWIKHTALFLNAEQIATAYFDDVVQRYMALATKAQSIPEKPMAVWGGPHGNGGWWIKAGSWQAQAMRDAGAINPFDLKTDEITIAVSTESVLAKASNADFWFTEEVGMENLGAARTLEKIAAFQKSGVYHVHRRARPEHNAYDWYETAPIRPDLVLEDLVSIFHPELLPEHELYFFLAIR